MVLEGWTLKAAAARFHVSYKTVFNGQAVSKGWIGCSDHRSLRPPPLLSTHLSYFYHKGFCSLLHAQMVCGDNIAESATYLYR